MSNNDLFMKDEFTVYLPGVVDIVKGGVDERRIGGYASTESLDRQGEVVLQRGLDFTEFVQHGYFNDNHQQHTSAVVGVPDFVRFDAGKGWWTEGYLLKGIARAEEIWKLAQALNGTGRKLGFSIEGKVLERREGNKIAKARVRHVAITNSPVNTDCTWGVLAKSFCVHAGEPTCIGTCCDIGKALAVGHGVATGTGGLAANTDGGAVLRMESLEGGKHVFKCPECKVNFATARRLDGHMTLKHAGVAKSAASAGFVVRRNAHDVTREEAIELVRQHRPDWPEGAAARIVDLVIQGAVS